MTPDLSPLARPSGGLAMVAMDQRESLRTMIAQAGGGEAPVPDSALVDVKLAVAARLGPLASGFLIDRHYGFEKIRRGNLLCAQTGLILAADALDQPPGGVVEDTDLDEHAVAPQFDRGRAVALKLLVIWRRDHRRTARLELARSFVTAADRLGLLSVLEAVVRPTPDEPHFDADAAAREAARELSTVGQSLYKVQVPRTGLGPEPELLSACTRLAKAITGPWVVLSQGVPREHFLTAVTAACRAGASGFLAGRALWSDVVGAADLSGALDAVAVPRLARLTEVVDRYARPWTAA